MKRRNGKTYFGSYAWVTLLIIMFIILAVEWAPLTRFILNVLEVIFGR